MQRLFGAVGGIRTEPHCGAAVVAIGVRNQQQANRAGTAQAGLAHHTAAGGTAQQCSIDKAFADKPENQTIVVVGVVEHTDQPGFHVDVVNGSGQFRQSLRRRRVGYDNRLQCHHSIDTPLPCVASAERRTVPGRSQVRQAVIRWGRICVPRVWTCRGPRSRLELTSAADAPWRPRHLGLAGFEAAGSRPILGSSGELPVSRNTVTVYRERSGEAALREPLGICAEFADAR